MNHTLSRLTGLCAALVVSGCGKRPDATPPRPPRPVIAAVAESREVPLYMDEIGRCDASESVTIQPQVSGPIVGVHFTDGAEVDAGDLLFTIDPRPYQAALDKARAILAQDRAKATFDEEQLKRSEELRQTKVATSQELDSARSAFASSQASLLADEASVQSAQINLDYCSIRSPLGARTGRRLVDAGNVVTANVTPLVRIQKQDPIYADFTVPERALPRVREYLRAGTLKVHVSFADDPAKNRTGDVNFLDSGIEAGTGTVRLRATLDNQDRLFWPGQFVNVRLLLDTLKDAVLVPAEAVQIGGKGPFLFVVKPDNTVELRPIKPGQRQGPDVVIIEGLKAGETVVVTGQLALAPGASVTITPPATAN